MNFVRFYVFIVSLFFTHFLFAADVRPPFPATAQNIRDYKLYINSVRGEARNHNIILAGPAKRMHLVNAFRWAENDGILGILEAGNVDAGIVEYSLVRASFWAKLLLDKRNHYINYQLATDDPEGRARWLQYSFDCQKVLERIFPYYADDQPLHLKKLFNHAYIWWAMLSIRRTEANFDEAWVHLSRVDIPPYTRVALLWKAHLILKNNYCPPPLVHLVEARRLLEALHVQTDLGRVAVPPQGPANNNDEEIRPPRLNSRAMRELEAQLLTELVEQETAAMAAAHQNQVHSSDDENGSESDDEDNDDDDGNDGPASLMPPANNDRNGDDDSDFDSSEEIVFDINPRRTPDKEAPKDSVSARRLRTLIGDKPLTDIDRLAIDFLNQSSMPKKLVNILEARYPKVQPNLLNPEKRSSRTEQGNRQRMNDLPLARLVHHYSLEQKKERRYQGALLEEVFEIFQSHFEINAKSSRRLHHYFIFPDKRKHDRILFYEQLLAYRNELTNKNFKINRLTTNCNIKFGTIFSKMDCSFIKEKPPVKKMAVINSYKKHGNKYLKNLDDGDFFYTISMLWHHLDVLPAKELDEQFSLNKKSSNPLHKEAMVFLREKFKQSNLKLAMEESRALAKEVRKKYGDVGYDAEKIRGLFRSDRRMQERKNKANASNSSVKILKKRKPSENPGEEPLPKKRKP